MPRAVRALRQQRAERGSRASPPACRARAASGTCVRAARTTGDTRSSRRAGARCRRPARRPRPRCRRAPTPRRGSSGRCPTSRTLAPSALNQASRPHPSANAAMNHAVIGPHETATTCPMSKNVWFAAERVEQIQRVERDHRLDGVLAGVAQRLVRQAIGCVARRVVRVAVADGREVEPRHVAALEDGEVGVVRQPAIDLDRERRAARVRRRSRPRLDDPAVARARSRTASTCRPIPSPRC